MVDAHAALDDTFREIVKCISFHVEREASKSARVRFRAWLSKLNEVERALELKKNRNLHARALLEMLRRGRVTRPFDGMPRDGRLGRFVREDGVGLELEGAFDATVEHERAARDEASLRREHDAPSADVASKVLYNASRVARNTGARVHDVAAAHDDVRVDEDVSKRDGDDVVAEDDDCDITAILDGVILATSGRVQTRTTEREAYHGRAKRSAGASTTVDDVGRLRALVDELQVKLQRAEAKTERHAARILSLQNVLEVERKARASELTRIREKHKREVNALLANVAVGRTPQSVSRGARRETVSSPPPPAVSADDEFDAFITSFVSETERLRGRLERKQPII